MSETAAKFKASAEQRDEFGEKVCALAEWLDDQDPGTIDPDDPLDEQISETSYDEHTFDAPDRCEYLVLTEDEADQRAADYIRESVWAFNASFLLSYMADGVTEEFITAIQEKLCEGANDGLRAMIQPDEDTFIEDAISCDGRAHFLNTYDGEEHEVKLDNGGGTFYIYRVN